MKQGLKPYVWQDHRDYDAIQSFGAVAPAQFPTEFNVDAGLWMPDQNAPQAFPGIDNIPALPFGCTDYSQTDLCVNEDLKLLSPMALENITHANAKGGSDIKTSLEAAKQAFGRTAYFNIKKAPPLDWFDSLRLVMLSTPEEKRAISIGIPWYQSFENLGADNVLPNPQGGLSWHNALISGWDARGLKIKSWQGPEYGENGWCYMPRALVNQLMDIPGTCAFTISKMAPKQITTIDVSFLEWFVSLIRNIFKPVNGAVDPDTLVPDWSKPENAYHNTRVLCDLAGLSVDEKNLICACVFQESQFLNTAIGRNKNAQGHIVSTDWGLAQVNDFYHIGPHRDFPSVEYVLAHPDRVINWMILMYKHGLLKQWISYSSGAYQKWLQPTSPMWDLGKQFLHSS